MADSDVPADSKGYIIFNLNVALIVITSVIVTLRLYVRGFMTKVLGPDDFLTIISFVSGFHQHTVSDVRN